VRIRTTSPPGSAVRSGAWKIPRWSRAWAASPATCPRSAPPAWGPAAGRLQEQHHRETRASSYKCWAHHAWRGKCTTGVQRAARGTSCTLARPTKHAHCNVSSTRTDGSPRVGPHAGGGTYSTRARLCIKHAPVAAPDVAPIEAALPRDSALSLRRIKRMVASQQLQNGMPSGGCKAVDRGTGRSRELQANVKT